MKIISSLLLTLSSVAIFGPEPKDKLVGRIVAEWQDDGRKMKPVNEFAYIDPSCKQWKVPAGTAFDVAKIPA